MVEDTGVWWYNNKCQSETWANSKGNYKPIIRQPQCKAFKTPPFSRSQWALSILHPMVASHFNYCNCRHFASPYVAVTNVTESRNAADPASFCRKSCLPIPGASKGHAPRTSPNVLSRPLEREPSFQVMWRNRVVVKSGDVLVQAIGKGHLPRVLILVEHAGGTAVVGLLVEHAVTASRVVAWNACH